MSTNWTEDEFPDWPEPTPEEMFQSYTAQPLPAPQMEEAGADPFARQTDVPGHNQAALNCRVVLVGGGGLNSSIGMGLIRSGVTGLTVIDPDRVDRTNLSRQLFFPDDLGQIKGPRLAHNLVQHSSAQARVTGIGMYFEDALEAYPLPCDLLVVGVDNNRARLAAARFGRERGVPVVTVALSLDGMRVNAFLQTAEADSPCWHCAQPNIDPDAGSPCAAAIISSCFLAAAFAIYFCHRALMGWPTGVEPFNWREADLQAVAPNRTGIVQRRPDCPTCGG